MNSNESMEIRLVLLLILLRSATYKTQIALEEENEEKLCDSIVVEAL